MPRELPGNVVAILLGPCVDGLAELERRLAALVVNVAGRLPLLDRRAPHDRGSLVRVSALADRVREDPP